MIAVQALEKRTAELKQKEAQIAVLESKVEELKAKQASFESVAARLEALELRQHQSGGFSNWVEVFELQDVGKNVIDGFLNSALNIKPGSGRRPSLRQPYSWPR